jgi:maltose O-acetyltransferase
MGQTSNGNTPLLVERTIELAREHGGAGRRDEAELLYAQVLGVVPGHVDAACELALLLRARGDGAGAVALLRKALDDQPSELRLRDALAELGPAPALQATVPQRLAARARPALVAAMQRPRIWKYQALSSCPFVSGGTPIRNQPVLFVGQGQIVLGEDVQFGWLRSPLFFTGYCHVEAARGAVVELGDRGEFNNNTMIKSEGPGVRIGADALFGAHVEIFDSNFHDLHPARRRGGTPRMAPVEIAENVFMGMGVRVLKGVTIGADSVIGAGSVVTAPIPAGVIAAGNPARVVREL